MSRGASFPIDVIIPGAGRVKKQSGVFTKGERDDLVAMLRLLPKQGHVALVQDIQAGRRAVLDVYAHYTAGTLEALRGPNDEQPLAPIADEWLDGALCADGTRDNRRDAFRVLRSLTPRKAQLRDLPDLLRLYRERCEANRTPRVFNVARTAVQAFLRDKVGKRKPLALAVADIPPLRERKQGRPGFALIDAVAIRDGLGGQAGRIWWSMVLTGMGPKELWGAWSVQNDRVHIDGTKVVRVGQDAAFGRVRDVPLVDVPVRPELTRDGFTSALRRYSAKQGTKVTPYQARKTFARWMEDAGVPRTRREIYRGHGKRDIGDVYERYEVSAYLREDAERMRSQLGPQRLALAQ
jgi:integrase